jgi:hypothetical protein
VQAIAESAARRLSIGTPSLKIIVEKAQELGVPLPSVTKALRS